MREEIKVYQEELQELKKPAAERRGLLKGSLRCLKKPACF